MSEVKGITNIGLNQNNIMAAKASQTGSASFSSYMEETKSLDDIFEQAGEKYKVPAQLLKAIGKAESDFRPSVVSRSGAQGIMQLMPATAAELGVKDAFDPEQNIMGGAKYISQLLKKYDGDTSLALAAYNAGMNNVKKYGGIPPFEETQNYVVKVTKYMQQNVSAGSVTVSGAKENNAQGNGTGVTPSVSVKPSWYLAPSELTNQPKTSDISDFLNSIFSYEDYLKLLEMFYRDTEKDETKQHYYF